MKIYMLMEDVIMNMHSSPTFTGTSFLDKEEARKWVSESPHSREYREIDTPSADPVWTPQDQPVSVKATRIEWEVYERVTSTGEPHSWVGKVQGRVIAKICRHTTTLGSVPISFVLEMKTQEELQSFLEGIVGLYSEKADNTP